VDNGYMIDLFGYTMNRLVGLDEAERIARTGDFSGPAILRFGQIWEHMARNGYITPSSAANIFPAGQIHDLGGGRAAMYLNGTWLPNELKGVAPDFRWGSFAFPAIDSSGDGIETNNFGAQGFAINKNSKHPDEAFRFIAWMTTGEWDTTLARETIGIPMADDAGWPEQLAEAKVVLDATTKRMLHANSFDILPEVSAKIGENFARLIKGDFNARQFADAMRR
jgi:raffinose/stachyose/melibiose transport system substrate-binding protein